MKRLILSIAIIAFFFSAGFSQHNNFLSTENWLKDATTFTFSKPADRKKFKHSFNGLRLIFEPQLGIVIQNGNDKFEARNFRSLDRIGLETNLYKGIVTFQGLFFYPSVVQLADRANAPKLNS